MDKVRELLARGRKDTLNLHELDGTTRLGVYFTTGYTPFPRQRRGRAVREAIGVPAMCLVARKIRCPGVKNHDILAALDLDGQHLCLLQGAAS